MRRIPVWGRVGVLALAGLVLAGCVTTDMLQPGQGYRVRFEGVGYSRLWQAAVQAVGEQMPLGHTDPHHGVIQAATWPQLKTWGQVLAVFITPADRPSPAYTVEVVSRNRALHELGGHHFTWEVVQRMREILRQSGS